MDKRAFAKHTIYSSIIVVTIKLYVEAIQTTARKLGPCVEVLFYLEQQGLLVG